MRVLGIHLSYHAASLQNLVAFAHDITNDCHVGVDAASCRFVRCKVDVDDWALVLGPTCQFAQPVWFLDDGKLLSSGAIASIDLPRP